MDGGSPTAFCYCYEFKPNLDRLALNYVFELRLSRCFFAVLLKQHVYRHWQQGSRFFMQIPKFGMNGCDRAFPACAVAGA
jgi:hypothetical protein